MYVSAEYAEMECYGMRHSEKAGKSRYFNYTSKAIPMWIIRDWNQLRALSVPFTSNYGLAVDNWCASGKICDVSSNTRRGNNGNYQKWKGVIRFWSTVKDQIVLKLLRCLDASDVCNSG
jgi:hypothetical protein